MMPLLRAEVRKLLTVRSTYVLALVGLLMTSFIAFWAIGYKSAPYPDATLIANAVTTASAIIGTFVAITAVLVMAHEYRHNTIMYTLTASNSRTKVLIAKILVMTAHVLVVTLVAMVVSGLLAWLGKSMSGNPLGPQTLHYWSIIWRSLFFVWGYAMVGLMVATLFRHVVGAIVVLLIVPSTVEGLLTLLIKENGKYLPFTALEQVHSGSVLSPGKGALVFGIYLVVGWAIAWFLFLKRDAN